MTPFPNIPDRNNGHHQGCRLRHPLAAAPGYLSPQSGHVLVYVIVVMLIFAALGAGLLTVFSSSSTSSATPNETRRAFNIYESGYRYALSELTDTSFSANKINALNTTTYRMNNNGEFVLNVFGPWFNAAGYNETTAIGPINLKVVRGELPTGFSVPIASPHVSIVNLDYTGTSIPASGSAQVTGYSYTDSTHFTLTVNDDFVANNNEQVCLAVPPYQNQTVSNSGSLTVAPQGQGILPRFNGAIEVNRRLLFYRERQDDPGGFFVTLTGLRDKSNGTFSFPVTTTDYVILHPANYYIVPEGRSNGVNYGGNMNYAVSTYDVTPFGPDDPNPDIRFEDETDLAAVLNPIQSVSGFTGLNNTEKKIIFERTSGNPFGAVWFKDTRAIGGQKNFCQNGACLFGDGIRAFFVFTFSGGGDGFTFSLLSAGDNAGVPNNTFASVGGDFELGELIGFAGDSRLDNNTPTPTYLDGSGVGLKAPKMAVEFDGFYNNNPVSYCSSSTATNFNTRIDPLISGGGRDAVQYVFWGSRNPLLAPCRGNKALYDDNRHDPQENTAAQNWRKFFGETDFTAPDFPDGNSRMAIAPDGTSFVIYLITGDNDSATDGRVHAIKPDNTAKWVYQPSASGGDDDPDSIVLDAAGNIYVGTDDDNIISLNPNGGSRWTPASRAVDGDNEAPMAIGEARSEVYVVPDSGNLFAFNKNNGNLNWQFNKSETGSSFSGVSIDPTSGSETLYFGSDNGRLYAVRATSTSFGTQRWSYLTPSTEPVRSRPAINPANRDVIFGSNNNYVYCLPYSSSTTPSLRWQRLTNGDVLAAPAITPDGSRVYVGNMAGVFYALNASNGSEIWKYPTSGSIGAIKGAAAIAPDGTIYFGTENGILYAMDPSGALKWSYNTGSPIRSEPKIGPDGTIYCYSADGNLHSVNPFTSPRNLRNLYLTDNELNAGVSGADWFGQGPWAVRVEVDRSQSVNGSGNYEYTLRSWLRRCTDATACSDINGTLFANTRLRYEATPASFTSLPMTQEIELSSSDQALFNRFLFGFTSGSGTNQTINIRRFQLSFIRPNDPVVDRTGILDPNFWP